MNTDEKIYVAGHRGMVGAAIVRSLSTKGYTNIAVKTHEELDLTNQTQVENFFKREKPEIVILAAAKVGGIGANIKQPVEFLLQNLQIECNVIKSAFENNAKKLVFLGSACIYPKNADQPLKEEYLLSGYLEPTNEGYALAKIAGIKLCEYYFKQYGAEFISVMPCNLYGPKDNFSLESSHVMAALIRKIHEGKMENKPWVEIWGSGNQYREFLYVEDMADAVIYLMENYKGTEFVNIGTGKDITIRELAQLVQSIIGYEGNLKFDSTKPDGMYRKVLDVTRLNNLGWRYKTQLEAGIQETYNWFLNNVVTKF
jgi:GDP-L-fucose synthase